MINVGAMPYAGGVPTSEVHTLYLLCVMAYLTPSQKVRINICCFKGRKCLTKVR